eukprot:TRINITY_DN16150_c0_g3_i1.p1 TRINITY_DN16150_c0_g3~~TRINITY_DN16150_c0_g3_i1.p1  ORF type:complete len:258 (-),score=22.26 TRINITY_DN16150_c0_g3_i1:118-891(-)
MAYLRWFGLVLFCHTVLASAKRCEDLIDHCSVHKRNGGCDEANADHPTWRKNCVKTCGYCDDRRYNPDICIDTVPFCHTRKSKCHLDHWKKHCPKTCNACGTYPVAACHDKVPGCIGHKANGGCNTGNEYFRSACVRTCGLCHEPHYYADTCSAVRPIDIGKPSARWGKCNICQYPPQNPSQGDYDYVVAARIDVNGCAACPPGHVPAFPMYFEDEQSVLSRYKGLSENVWCRDCLLYTSDAADDLLCVDLGGRRII